MILIVIVIMHSTMEHGYNKPLNYILDMKIKYITISNKVLIIEATH